MPAERAPMRKVREVLRLRHALGVSERQIAMTTGLSRSTVGELSAARRRHRHHLADARRIGRCRVWPQRPRCGQFRAKYSHNPILG